MSYQIGLNSINLKPTPRLGHAEYYSHHAQIKKVTAEDAQWQTPKFCEASAVAP